MVEILFSREKVSQNVSENKLVGKNAMTVVWELLALVYALLLSPAFQCFFFFVRGP